MPGEPVAVLGVGRMGSAAAKRLSSHGFTVRLWNRSLYKAERVAESIGGLVFKNPWDAVSDASIALAFLADDNALFNVVSQLRRSDGLVFVNSSTNTPKASTTAASILERLGVTYIEAPIVGGPGALERGEAILLVAGKDHAKIAAKRVLEILGEIIDVSHEYGRAAALKLAFNNLLLATVVSLGESLLILDAYGVDASLFKELLEKTAFKGLASKYFDRAIKGDNPTFIARLAEKDARYAYESLVGMGVPPLLSNTVSQVYSILSYLGEGEGDYVGVYAALKRLYSRGRKEGV